jgi:hypothetical protein
MTGAAATAMLTGCSTDEPERRRTSGSARDAARTGATLRSRLAATSRALCDQYDAALAQHPSLTRQLTALRAAVAEHVTALAGTGATASPAPSPSLSPPLSAAPVKVSADPRAALKALAAAERRTSDAHMAALAGTEPELARLLASIAAADAAHAYLLTKGDTR